MELGSRLSRASVDQDSESPVILTTFRRRIVPEIGGEQVEFLRGFYLDQSSTSSQSIAVDLGLVPAQVLLPDCVARLSQAKEPGRTEWWVRGTPWLIPVAHSLGVYGAPTNRPGLVKRATVNRAVATLEDVPRRGLYETGYMHVELFSSFHLEQSSTRSQGSTVGLGDVPISDVVLSKSVARSSQGKESGWADRRTRTALLIQSSEFGCGGLASHVVQFPEGDYRSRRRPGGAMSSGQQRRQHTGRRRVYGSMNPEDDLDSDSNTLDDSDSDLDLGIGEDAGEGDSEEENKKDDPPGKTDDLDLSTSNTADGDGTLDNVDDF
ncbi:unnamed protein product [Cyprideis torosa]|uniref:Uncharacterized protein n=1 Tax=Cyprideis torosa TaxID=163714 RepID=A0A7R8ZM08_9CRUS|nr:unnamed protein product [Cyprideis torosa]CAG0893095.1 unnamed protein product [Cyprideis torosa]